MQQKRAHRNRNCINTDRKLQACAAYHGARKKSGIAPGVQRRGTRRHKRQLLQGTDLKGPGVAVFFFLKIVVKNVFLRLTATSYIYIEKQTRQYLTQQKRFPLKFARMYILYHFRFCIQTIMLHIFLLYIIQLIRKGTATTVPKGKHFSVLGVDPHVSTAGALPSLYHPCLVNTLNRHTAVI